MIVRDNEIQQLVDALAVAIGSASKKYEKTTSGAAFVFSALRTIEKQCDDAGQSNFPALEFLPAAVRSAQSGAALISALAGSLEVVASRLRWFQRLEPDMPDFVNGHANAHIIGPRGLEIRDDVVIGVTVMKPGLIYPNHQHPPDEMYVALSNGEWWQEGGAWHSPGCGGLVYNPSNITHTMRSGSQPLLAIWCLWTT